MSDVPVAPAPFFTSYIPARFAELAGFEQAHSAGSVLFTVPQVGTWAFRLVAGKLLVEGDVRPDAIVAITIPEASFLPVVVAGAERLHAQTLSPERQLLAFRALTLDAERAALIRGVAGTVAFAVVDGSSTHRVFVTPGAATPNVVQPECEISCEADAFWGLQSGAHNPIELLMSGKLRIAGDVQIPMALSGLFV
jgi:hypothetical protein